MKSLDPYLTWFDRFVESFPAETEEDKSNILLKQEHSLRVLEEARGITAALALGKDPELESAVHLAALLHDLGRFPQYARYKCYRDEKSENHARLGVKTLGRTGLLKGLPAKARGIIVGAVFTHNLAALPSGLSPETELAARVVRDADKLDILSLVLRDFLRPGQPERRVFVEGLNLDGSGYSERVLRQVLGGRQVDYRNVVFLNDFKLLLCGWVYDFNFPHTCAKVLDQGFLEELIAYLPPTQEFYRLGEQIISDVMRQAVQKKEFQAKDRVNS